MRIEGHTGTTARAPLAPALGLLLLLSRLWACRSARALRGDPAAPDEL